MWRYRIGGSTRRDTLAGAASTSSKSAWGLPATALASTGEAA
jgi:hypothetical protein